jgi:hypothetical protein
MDLALFIRRLKHPARPALALPRAQALGNCVTMSSLSPVPIVPGTQQQMDGAMGKVRSASDRVIPAFILLISALIADSGAQAQIAANPNDSNRVKVLEIREASDSKASSVKRHKSAAAPANKKVVLRNTARHGRATTNEVASRQLSNSNMLVEPAISVDANATSAQNDTPGLSPEQTGTAAVDTHGAALASSFGEDNNVGLVGNPRRAIADAEQAPNAEIAAGEHKPSEGSKSSSQSQVLATLSGAMLAGAFGWYLLGSSRRRAFV